MTPLDPRLYLVLDPVRTPSAETVLRSAVAGGVTAVQVRAPGVPARHRIEAVRGIRALLDGGGVDSRGVAVTVDDDLDTALATDADGVHLGQGDLSPREARRRAGPGFSVGWSVSRPEHVRAAGELPAGTVDLLGAGPVYATATKPDADAPTGLDGLAELVAAAPVAVVAIGGIDPDNAAEVVATGVDGLAVSSAITDARDPARAAQALREAVER